jgi:hypothetical protein
MSQSSLKPLTHHLGNCPWPQSGMLLIWAPRSPLRPSLWLTSGLQVGVRVLGRPPSVYCASPHWCWMDECVCHRRRNSLLLCVTGRSSLRSEWNAEIIFTNACHVKYEFWVFHSPFFKSDTGCMISVCLCHCDRLQSQGQGHFGCGQPTQLCLG